MNALADRRIIITGAGAGIGLAVLQRFVQEGAKVVAVVRRQEHADALSAQANVVTLVGDVASYEVNAQAVELAQSHFGGLDVFIANAGLWDFHKRLAKIPAREVAGAYDEVFAVNVRAPLFGARAAFEALRVAKGAFIATASNASFRAGGGGALYTASKFALRGLIMQLAVEFAPDVRVNAIAPGATDTALSGAASLGQRSKALNLDAARLSAMADHIPLGRISAPEEHAGLYVLLASATGAPYVTGATLVSDGGLIAST